jgi:class 3 adenylate cyclase
MVIHLIAGALTYITIDLMQNVTEFALDVREHDLTLLPYWRAFAYSAGFSVSMLYLWPLVAYFRNGLPQPAPLSIRRRAVSFPSVLGLVGLAPWLLSAIVFPVITRIDYGRWSTELMSQQVLSPLVNGVFAATTAYLFTDWVARSFVIPKVFPDGRTSTVTGAFTFGVRARLFIFLVAVAFLPMFTMLGLIRAANVRFEGGMDADIVIQSLGDGASGVFLVFVVFGLMLTLLLARTFTAPLAAVAAALRRVRGGDLSVAIAVDAGDELGILEEGVNDMVSGLRERDRIMAAFGRAVEPAVRDRLLAGELRLGGELRTATVMFCDLRGFTALAERSKPDDVVATLNEFFTAATTWVRSCGGFVDKFIGDALLVVFGLFDEAAGEDGQVGAEVAVRCALGMRERLAELNDTRAREGKSRLAVAMVIHSGEVLAGTIGAEDRHEYTVIGDTVNIAARLQQICKEREHDLVVSRATFELATRGGAEVAVAAQESVTLRGRAEPVSYLALA